jgi:hypothetical protein
MPEIRKEPTDDTRPTWAWQWQSTGSAIYCHDCQRVWDFPDSKTADEFSARHPVSHHKVIDANLG